MEIRLNVIIILMFSLKIFAADTPIDQYGMHPPSKDMNIAQIQELKNKQYTITLYEEIIDSNTSYKAPQFFLKICSHKTCGWISSPEDLFFDMKLLEFYDKNNLMILGSTDMWRATYMVSLPNRKVVDLGGGYGIKIKKGKYAGNIRMVNRKGYVMINHNSNGAYWASYITDKDGNMIKMLDDKFACNKYPLRYLIDTEKQYPKLEQSLDTLICVEQ